MVCCGVLCFVIARCVLLSDVVSSCGLLCVVIYYVVLCRVIFCCILVCVVVCVVCCDGFVVMCCVLPWYDVL